MSTESFWRPDDPGWMRERKQLWMQIRTNLNVISARYTPFKRKYHKYHKELFFFGTLNPDGVNKIIADLGGYETTGHKTFMSVLPLFKIWYHPKPEELDLDQMRASFMRHESLRGAWERFFSYMFASGAGYPNMFPADYGMMGGREELCAKFLFPRLDWRDEVRVTERSSPQQMCPGPFTTFSRCVFDTIVELQGDALFVPYAPGQYLWNHLSFALDKYPDDVFDPRTMTKDHVRRNRERLLEVVAEILRFEERRDPSRNRPSTIALVERLTGMYERKEFSDAMMRLWEEAKALPRTTTYRHVSFYEQPEDIRQRFGGVSGFPIEEQEKRIRQWRQV